MSVNSEFISADAIVNTCETYTKVLKRKADSSFKWVLRDFGNLVKAKISDIISSERFFLGPNRDISYTLNISPHQNNKWIGFFLSVHPYFAENKINLKLSILLENNKIIYTKEFLQNISFQYTNLILENDYSHLAKKHGIKDLILFCEIEGTFNLLRQENFVPLQENKVSDPEEAETFDTNPASQYYNKLFADGLFTDVTFQVENQKLNAHKGQLAASSPVFFAMFQNDWGENQTGKIKITDFSYSTFKEMLRFIYTGRIEEEENLEELMGAAHKYDIQNLIKVCETKLGKKVNLESAWSLLAAADKYGAKSLKNSTIHFIWLNKRKLMKLPLYQGLFSTNPGLIEEFFALEVKL